MAKKDTTVGFNDLEAKKYSNKLNDEILELQKRKAVIDELVSAKTLYSQLDSTNKSIKKQIDANKELLVKGQQEVSVIQDKKTTEKILAEQELDEINAGVKAKKLEARDKIREIAKVADEQADSKVADAEDRVKVAEANAKDSERYEAEMTTKKKKAEKECRDLENKILAGIGGHKL